MRRSLCLLASLLAAAFPGAAAPAPLSLEDCLGEVARNNPALAVQRARVQEALGTRLTLRARALPTLRLGILAGQQGDEGTSINHPGDLRDSDGKRVAFPEQRIDRGSRLVAIGTGLFLQPLFDLAIPPTWRRGTLEVAIARENFVAASVATLHQARLVYYQAVFARETRRVLAEVAAQLDENAKAVGEMARAGLAGRQALLQAQVQRQGYEPSILANQGAYEVALSALWGLMGREGGDPPRDTALSTPLTGARLPEFDSAAVAPAALERRPDLRTLRQLVQAYREDARILRANYYPDVQIIITAQALPQNFVRSSRPNALRAGDEIDTSEVRFGARYQWDVIDTGAIQGSAQRVDRLRETLETSLRRLEQNIPRDLSLLRAQTVNLTAQAAALEGGVATAGDTLKLVSDAVRGGSSSQLDVIDAENGVLNSQLGLLSVQWQTNVARADFDRITGGYVRLVDDPPNPAAPAPPRPPAQAR